MENFDINWSIVKDTRQSSRKFNTIARNLTVRLNYDLGTKNISLRSVIEKVEESLNSIIQNLTINVDKDDYIRIALRNALLDNEIFIPFRKKRHFSVDLLINEILKVSQSKREFLYNGLIEIDFITVKQPIIGGSRNASKIIDLNVWRKNSTKVIPVKGDGLCLARSIVVSKAHIDGIRKNPWRQIREDVKKVQTKLALELCKKAGVNVDNNGVNFEDFQKFQTALGDEYQLIIVTPPSTFLFKGKKYSEKQLFVQIIHNHCDSLLSIRSFLRTNYYCRRCQRGYMTLAGHKCEGTCKYCFYDPPCEYIDPIKCDKCNRSFANRVCFENHISKTKICKVLKYCETCRKIVKSTKNHLCGFKICKNCKQNVPIGYHDCYVIPLSKEKLTSEDNDPKIFCFYDFESIQETSDNNMLIHKPNLCFAKCVCQHCWNSVHKERTVSFCEFCGAEDKLFDGLDAVNDFVNWLFIDYGKYITTKKREMKLKKEIKILLIAHNSKAYDAQFILKHCINSRFTPSIIKKGTKILRMKVKNYLFIDSLNFLQMPLKQIPKSFNFNKDVAKGDFPHLFNLRENWNYIGMWPDIKYYQPELMTCKDRDKFIMWYDKQKDKTFNFQKEIKKYCQNDVNILLKGVMTFRDSWIKISGLDCFTRNFTLAQSVMEIYKANYLMPNKIPIIPNNGYDPKRKQSYVANCWLDFMQLKRQYTIHREYKLGSFYADGFITETREVFEFFGCIFHGCVFCYTSRRSIITNPYNNETMESLYQKLLTKIKFYKNINLNLTLLWECEFKKMRKKDKELDYFFTNHLKHQKNIKKLPPIEPREAFYGGRVNAAKLYYEAKNDEKIYYMDFCSLYPYVVKRKQYPIGHPVRITYDFEINIENYEGLIFCKILPPKQLYFPVLPIRMHNRLIFALCYECCLKQSQISCEHNDEQRSIIGTWVTAEVKHALKLGYKIIEIYEVWHYKETSNDLFCEFINDCIKGKIENSDWPENDMTEEQKNEYINKYKEHEDIILEAPNIQNNPGLRNIFKLQVNSFWAKFSQQNNKSTTEYIFEALNFFKLLSDDSISVNDAFLITDEAIQVEYKKNNEFIEEHAQSSVIIACYVTTYARLELYNLLYKLGTRCLYFDTDSVIFSGKSDDWIPETGIFLGQLTNELPINLDKDVYISKFACCGAKNYSYEIMFPSQKKVEYVCKVKGLTLNFQTENLVNFNTMKSLVQDYVNVSKNCSEQKILQIPQMRFNVSRFNDVFTSYTEKSYKLVYNKRRLVENFGTLPFGYCDTI